MVSGFWVFLWACCEACWVQICCLVSGWCCVQADQKFPTSHPRESFKKSGFHYVSRGTRLSLEQLQRELGLLQRRPEPPQLLRLAPKPVDLGQEPLGLGQRGAGVWAV